MYFRRFWKVTALPDGRTIGTVMVRACEGGNLILPEPSRQNGYTPEHAFPIVISGATATLGYPGFAYAAIA